MRAPAKLALFALALVALLGGGLAMGAAVGSIGDDDGDGGRDATTAVPDGGAEAALPGLSVSAAGLTLAPETTVLRAGVPQPFHFAIVDDTGNPVLAFDETHQRELHFIVVGRDLTEYAHLHPERDDTGRWTVDVPALAPGPYRVYADFAATGHEPVTLGVDIAVPGDYQPAPLPAPTSVNEVDDYVVEIDGALTGGTETTVTLTVRDEGGPVTDLEPYLGALGHLVAIRDGDLAYLHVHPLDDDAGAGVRFAVEVPTAGTYRLFFEFAHADAVHTVDFTVEVAPGGTPASPVEDDHGHDG